MTNFLHAKYDSSGNQIDDPTVVIGQPEFAVDSTGAVTGFVALGKPYNVRSPFYGRRVGCIGDSLTQVNEVCGRAFNPVNVTGVALTYAELSTSAGNATLVWNAANRTLTWTAPGDTAGTPVVVTDGFFTLQSGSPNMSVRAGVTSRSLPATNQTDTMASGNANWAIGPSWSYVADALTWGVFTFDNLGITGNMSTDLSARYTQMLGSYPDVVIDLSGTNDVATVTGATIASTRAANWDKALARGIPVIAVLIPPRYSGADAGGYTAAKQGALTGANLEIVRLARARKGVYILDAFSILSTAAGISKTGYTIDGIHQSGGMGYEIGRQLARLLTSMFPAEVVRPLYSSTLYYDATYRPAGNLMASDTGNFAGTGGTAGTAVTAGTGLAAGWTAARNSGTTFAATANKFTDPEGGPDWQEFVVTAAATVDGEYIWMYPNGITTNIAAGDLINYGVEFWVVGTGCYGVYMDLQHVGDTLAAQGSRSRQIKDVAQGLRDGERGSIRCIPHKLQSGITSLLPVINFQGKAGGTFTIRFRSAGVYKVF